jgi:hypothetical protein
LKTYKRTVFSIIQGLILTPFGGFAVFIIGNIFLPAWLCVILGIAAAAFLAYTTILEENIYFELDEDGTFRFFNRGRLKNTFELSKYSVGYHRKTEWGFLGNNNIRLKLLSVDGEETEIDAGPLGTARFNAMFAEMEKYSIADQAEPLAAAKKTK